MKLINKIIKFLGNCPADKALHFAVSSIVAVISVAVAHLCGCPPFWVIFSSAIVVTGVGLAKEYLIDSAADPWDLVANYAGAAVMWAAYLIAVFV